MKTVISASRRTDIPAFYLTWFMNAIRAGKLEVANPFYPKQTRIVDLTPQAVGWIVFWSRNYGPFLRRRSFFDDYQLFFHFTILPPSKLEKIGVDVTTALNQMRRLVELYGGERVIWRYDPLVYWEENGRLATNHQPEQFEALCREIGSIGVSRCYFSFAHPYAKFIQRFRKKFPADRLIDLPIAQKLDIAARMARTAARHGLNLYSCCNDRLLQAEGVHKGHCIDGGLLNRLRPEIRISQAKAPTRQDCGCTASIDIGSYAQQPCPYGCIYCYANPLWT